MPRRWLALDHRALLICWILLNKILPIHLWIMTSNNAFAARTCIAGVVVTNKSNMSTYFLEAGNLNSSKVDMCSDAARPSSSGSGDLFELWIQLQIPYFGYFPHYQHCWPPSWTWAWLQLPCAFRGVLRHYAFGLYCRGSCNLTVPFLSLSRLGYKNGR